MKNIFSKAFQRPCYLMMALLLAMVSTVAGAQSLLRVSDDSYKRGLDRFKKGDLNGAIEEFDHAPSTRTAAWRVSGSERLTRR
jgi:hypothetical protein